MFPENRVTRFMSPCDVFPRVLAMSFRVAQSFRVLTRFRMTIVKASKVRATKFREGFEGSQVSISKVVFREMEADSF